MKNLILVIIISLLSVSSFAAELMFRDDFARVKNDYIKVGTISVSEGRSPNDAIEELSQKAADKGGDIYVMTSPEYNNKSFGTADVFKKKE